MSKFRKKPVVIEATLLTELNEREVADWCGGQVNPATRYGKPIGGVQIPTLEGTMLANVGDWVIQGVQGEFYPCKPGIFAETYEAVDGE